MMLVITLPLMYVFRSAQTSFATYEKDTERHDETEQQPMKGLSLSWRYFAWILTGNFRLHLYTGEAHNLLCTLVILTMCALALCALSALTLDANNVNSLAAALQSCAISIAESLFISSPLVAVMRSWWRARKVVPADDFLPPAKKTNQFTEDQVILASNTVDQQWSPESLYPSLSRQTEPPITTNNLNSAIVPSQRNINQRTTNSSFIGV